MTKDKISQKTITTPQLPDTTPPVYPDSSYNFSIQAIFEMQLALGKLTQAIEHLTDQSKIHTSKLDQINHKISVAQGILIAGTVILTLIGSAITFLLTRLWDTVVPMLQIKPPH